MYFSNIKKLCKLYQFSNVNTKTCDFKNVTLNM